MVEARSLLIGPWTRAHGALEFAQAAGAGAWVRRVSDGGAGTPLGFAAWKRGGAGILSSWFGGRQITLFETEDASLVMTLRCGFWRLWEVCDAEEHPVGALYRHKLLDAGGGVLAHARKPRPPEGGAFLDYHNRELARFCPVDSGGWLVTFMEEPATTPFMRMVLLAAVLAWGPEPE